MALTAISSAPIDVAAVLASVQDPRAGGHSIFVGTVRADDEGRQVVGLAYEAHPSAERLLAEVAGRYATDDVVAVAAVHRTGDLVVGDVAVVVAVSAGHRAEAFTVCRALIDAVKSEVPIWKRETFAEGDHTWVGAP